MQEGIHKVSGFFDFICLGVDIPQQLVSLPVF